MLSFEEASEFPVVEGTVGFIHPTEAQWAIRYNDQYFPFNPDECIGWSQTFRSLETGNTVYFPLTPNYIRTHNTVTCISQTSTAINEILLWLNHVKHAISTSL